MKRADPLTRVISREEVSRHRTENDCWVILHGQVLALPPSVLKEHPGGADIILDVAGQDCTEEFEASCHSEAARRWAARYTIGVLDTELNRFEARLVPILKAFAALTAPSYEDSASSIVWARECFTVALALLSAASAGMVAWRLGVAAAHS